MILSPVASATFRLFAASPSRASSGSVVSPDYYRPSLDRQRIDKYYHGMKPDFLKLHKLLVRTHTHEAAYEPSKWVYPTVDRRPDGELHCLYTEERIALASPLDAARIGLELSRVTAEHVVARKWFGDRQPMRGDLHILFACDRQVNEERGHARFGEVGDGAIEGKGGRFSQDMTVFEPFAGKGPVARATLYFLTRYPGAISNYTAADLQTFLQWHREDPVSDYERHRNSEIQARQGNRNPFVDFPEWAEQVRFRL